MASEHVDAPNPKRSHRYRSVGVAAAVVVVVAALGLAVASASSAATIAHSSSDLHWANVSSGNAAVVRVAVYQAVVFRLDAALGVSSEEGASIASDEARTAIAKVNLAVESGTSRHQPIADQLSDFAVRGSAVLDALDAGEIPRAEKLVVNEFERTYEVVFDELAAAQSVAALEIDQAETFASRVDFFTRWIVLLFIPVAALVGYRVLIRRQYRQRQRELVRRLEVERTAARAKDEFIAGISHELRTPLTSILGFSDHLVDTELNNRAESLELVGLINQDSEDLSRMVEDLITAARLDAGQMSYDRRPVDLAVVAEVPVDRAKRQGADVRLRGELVLADTDPARARQIIHNLVSNAVRHGGSTIEVALQARAGRVVCRVMDDGQGVSEEVASRLFDRFVHAGKSVMLTGSVGLGLAISRTLSRELGGDLGYAREDGWSVFTLELPGVAATADEARAEELPANPNEWAAHPQVSKTLQLEPDDA